MRALYRAVILLGGKNMELTDLVQTIAMELNLDDDQTAMITGMVNTAIPVILNAVDSSKTYDDFKDNELFTLAVKTLTTQIYYERTLPDGLSKGLLAVVKQLQATQGAGEDGQN